MNCKNLVLALSIVSIAVFSCNDTPENPELDNYVNKTMPGFMKEELTIMKVYDSATKVYMYNSPEVDSSIRNVVIPNYTKFIEKLDTITIKDPELKTVHQNYILASKSQLEYFSMLLNSLKDPIKYKDTLNIKLSKQNTIMKDWNAGIRSLCKKYDIPFLEK